MPDYAALSPHDAPYSLPVLFYPAERFSERGKLTLVTEKSEALVFKEPDFRQSNENWLAESL